jgi:hypothetical protein
MLTKKMKIRIFHAQFGKTSIYILILFILSCDNQTLQQNWALLTLIY